MNFENIILDLLEDYDPIDPHVETPAWTMSQNWYGAETVDEVEKLAREGRARRHPSAEAAIQYAKTWPGTVAVVRQPDNTLTLAYANWDSN